MREKTIAAAENSRHANIYVRDYRAVDGRTYKTEAGDTRPLRVRRSVVRNGIANDRVSAIDIARVEIFLRTGDAAKARKMGYFPQKLRDEITAAYPLTKNDADGRWMGDEGEIFAILCERCPDARNFRSFKDAKYAMRYGDTRNGEVKITRVGMSDAEK